MSSIQHNASSLQVQPGSMVPSLLAFDASTEKSDAGNATRLLERHGADMRYIPKFKKWLVWNGKRWIIDENGTAMLFAEDTLRSLYIQAGNTQDQAERKLWAKFAIGCETEKRLRSMLNIAQNRPGVPVEPENLDSNPMLFNVENGTIDLTTGLFRYHKKEDLLTKTCPVLYDPTATCPTWTAFLDKVMGGNQGLISFLQRAIGYSLTGSTTEQCFFVLYGTGANGKSTFCDVLSTLMGSYGMVTPSSTLMAKGNDAIPNDVARLQNVRFVTSSETDDGRRLAESTIKSLTGDREVSARFMRGEYFQFTPIMKLFLSTNHKPQIKGTDNGIWRRVKLIPFTVTIPPDQQDKHLYEKLVNELPGILLWAIEGCLAWQQQGLNPPQEVIAATQEYRNEMSVLQQFLDEECYLDSKAQVTAKDLYSRYVTWCEENGERAESQRKFGQRLTEMAGIDRVKISIIYYVGLRLRTDTDPQTPTPTPEPETREEEKTPVQNELTAGDEREDEDQKTASHSGTEEMNETTGTKVSIVQPEKQQPPLPEHMTRLQSGMTVDTPDGRGIIELVLRGYVQVSVYGNIKQYSTPLQISRITPYTPTPQP